VRARERDGVCEYRHRHRDVGRYVLKSKRSENLLPFFNFRKFPRAPEHQFISDTPLGVHYTVRRSRVWGSEFSV
jgi:hypothetical protein